MTNNVLSAISSIVSFGSNDLKGYASTYLIRINAVGEQLEFYIKDAIANSFKLSQGKKQGAYSKIFSYLGNQNNPPDMIVKGGDAFEIKKIENATSSLALNSSPPKDKLRAADIRITDACRNCESKPWVEKDLFYVVGNAKGGNINYLFFIQGSCYAAKHEIYDKIRKKVKSVNKNGTFVYNPKFGKNKNPLKYFKRFITFDDKKFNLYAIIELNKYNSYPIRDRNDLENLKGIMIQDIAIPSQSNLQEFKKVKLIYYSI